MKILLAIIGGFLGIGALLPIVYELTDWGLNYLNTHSFVQRLIGVPGAIALASAFIAGGLIGGFRDYLTFKWSTTVQGESRFNPSYGIFIVSIIIHLVWIKMLE